MKSGYWQNKMDDKDREKTAFSVPGHGLFECNSLPFGLVNVPSVFQSLMTVVLEGLSHFCAAYLDDILIFSASVEEHVSHVTQVFERLRQHKLKLKLKKCAFFQRETRYLGYVISSKGISPDQEKIKVMRNMLPQTTIREARALVGTFSYYRRFLPNFSDIAAPVINLTKKYSKFKWTSECQKSFEFLKESLSVIPLLSYPDVNKSYMLYVDASDRCIGGCLTQPVEENDSSEDSANPYFKNERPIYFLSNKLSKLQWKWPIIEKECNILRFAEVRLLPA